MIYNYYLSLGSNIEPRLKHFQDAINKLSSYGRVIQKSSIYLTQPWGIHNQSNFYNAVIEYHTELAPLKLLQKIKLIEQEIGRKRIYRWGPREIDIDIILCEFANIEEPELHIPHKHFHERRFVLEPLVEIHKNPMTNDGSLKINELLMNCSDKSQIKKLTIDW